jgi:hypothetical protein
MGADMGVADRIRRLTRRSTPSIADLAKAHPIRSESATWRESEDGSVVVESVALRRSWGQRLLTGGAGSAAKRTFEFEPVGAFVWALCDGDQTVASVSKKLQARFKMSRLEADASLAAFLQTLAKRGLIRLESPKR